MSDCCTTNNTPGARPKKHLCPVHGKACAEVSVKTIMHHMKNVWQWVVKDQGYYFCDDPACDVVYFGEDNSVIKQNQLHTDVGIKNPSPEGALCYCFGITRKDLLDNPKVKDFVINMTNTGMCSCETRNPSGRCCLKYF